MLLIVQTFKELFFIYRPKSVPSSPMVKRAFSRLGTITAGWGRSIRKQHSQLNADDKKKWASSQDCSSKCENHMAEVFPIFPRSKEISNDNNLYVCQEHYSLCFNKYKCLEIYIMPT